MEYVLGTMFSVALMAFMNKTGHGSNKITRILRHLPIMIPLFIISALRWNVGTDTWHTYTPEYLAMMSEKRELTAKERQILTEEYKLLNPNLPEEKITAENALNLYRRTYHHTAPGFRVLERMLVVMNADVQWLYVMTSLISLSFIFSAISLQSGKTVLPCLFYVITGNFFLSLNVISQFMAISICLYACRFGEERKPLPFFLLVLLAYTFHASAVIFLPVYFLPRLKIRPFACAVIVLLTLVLAPRLVSLIEKLVRFLVPKYAFYLGTYLEFETIFFALDVVVFAIGTYYWKAGESKPYYRLWYYCNVLGMLSLCFSAYLPSMKRINYYFAAPHFLFLPLVVSCEKNLRKRILLKLVLIFLFIVETVVAVWMLNKNGVLPYRMLYSAEYMPIR